MHKHLIALFGLAVLGPFPAMASTTSQTESDVPIFFLADSQIHNLYGTSLKQMTGTADWVSKVAIRPPEVNILAPFTLRQSLERGISNLGDRTQLAVVLGDGTNIGCSGEADKFDSEFDRTGPNTIRLMAHGNHDSYLMGTVNSYGPAGEHAWKPGAMMNSNLPVDEAFWTPSATPVFKDTSLRGRNWLDACYAPRLANTPAGTPMNKVRWLARYSASLSKHGLIENFDGPTTNDGLTFSGTAVPGSSLANLNYRSRGVWYKPYPKDEGASANYARSWQSFSVQAVDIGTTHTLVLIDTSVRASARGGLSFPLTNAGTHGMIGTEQIDVIEKLLSEIPGTRHVIVAGHFPLDSIKRRDRTRLVRLMSSRSPTGWTYVSGHTHEALSRRPHRGGVDINIGSTTDWPIESHIIRFRADSAAEERTESTILKDTYEPLRYTPSSSLGSAYSELCRHYGVAEALASATQEMYHSAWASPLLEESECSSLQDRWMNASLELAGFQAEISRRFDAEPVYREFILRVAAGASRYEAGQRRIGPRRIP